MRSIFSSPTLAVILCIGTTLVPCNESDTPPPQVDLGYARYQGESLPIGVTQYLGMRYAAPPLGNLRFRAPQDPLKETEIVSTNKRGNICLGVANGGPPVPSGEDCLFVDVFAPVSATSRSKLPVMVWLQGGAFIQLINLNYNGTGLVKSSGDNVIVVSFNYRVGPYGFLASEKVREDGDLNVGLLDQRKALKWVSKHIGIFGGDPKQVNIFGTSIGSVLFNMLAYGGKGDSLFRSGISASAFIPSVYSVSDLEFQYQQLLDATECDSIACLRNLTADELQTANVYRPFPGQTQPPLFPYMPCIDGEVLEDQPSSLLLGGKFTKVPLLTGTSQTEGTIFAPQAHTTADINEFLISQYPHLSKGSLAAIDTKYKDVSAGTSPPGNETPQSPLFYRAATIYGDTAFSCQVYDFAAAFTAVGVPVYMFLNHILDPVEVAAGIIVPHTWETAAVWGPEYATNYAGLPGADGYETVNAAIVPVVQAYWTSFTRTGGDPNKYRAPGSPYWEQYRESMVLKLQTNSTQLQRVDSEQLKRCQFWSSLRHETHM